MRPLTPRMKKGVDRIQEVKWKAEVMTTEEGGKKFLDKPQHRFMDLVTEKYALPAIRTDSENIDEEVLKSIGLLYTLPGQKQG